MEASAAQAGPDDSVTDPDPTRPRPKPSRSRSRLRRSPPPGPGSARPRRRSRPRGRISPAPPSGRRRRPTGRRSPRSPNRARRPTGRPPGSGIAGRAVVGGDALRGAGPAVRPPYSGAVRVGPPARRRPVRGTIQAVPRPGYAVPAGAGRRQRAAPPRITAVDHPGDLRRAGRRRDRRGRGTRPAPQQRQPAAPGRRRWSRAPRQDRVRIGERAQQTIDHGPDGLDDRDGDAVGSTTRRPASRSMCRRAGPRSRTDSRPTSTAPTTWCSTST